MEKILVENYWMDGWMDGWMGVKPGLRECLAILFQGRTGLP
jgi:hypothetical protein